MEETIILRPVRREAPAEPLRDPVLAGRFLGEDGAAAGSRLAAFIAGGSLRDWLGEASPRDPAALRDTLDRDIAALDEMIGRQLDAVLHHPRFRAFEGRWRGLHWLAEGIEPGRRIKLRLLTITWPEICRDLERALEFDRSNLFQLVYEQEFGMPGGEPYGLLLIDHEVRHRPGPGAPTDDVSAIASLASVGAAAFAPVVLGASPALLDLGAWGEMERVQEPTAPLRDEAHARWRGLSTRADLRFVAIALPRLLARPPWRDDPARADRFRYRERGTERTWMGAGFAFAAVACRAFANHAWPADVRGAEGGRVGGGLVAGLPAESFRSGPDVWPRVPAEIALTDRQERALVEAGLMPVCPLPHAGEMVFGAARSLQAPARHLGQSAEAADANARLSAQLNAMLCASRFAHFLKVLGRDMVGSILTADEIQRRLHAWLQGYVNSNSNAGPEQRARYPLAEGQVRITERPGRPGVFACTAHLRPHHQLDDVSASFVLLTEIAAPGRRVNAP